MDIFKKIEKVKHKISEEDINGWLLQSIMDNYRSYIVHNARRNATNSNETVDDLYIKAYEEQAKLRLKSALFNFFIKYEHWKSNRNLDSYLYRTIKNMTCESFRRSQISEIKSFPVCPACKFFHQKEFLSTESGMLRCDHCTKESRRLEDEIKKIQRNNNGSVPNHVQSKFRLCSIFSLHSRKGYSCPDCVRFIPKSLINKLVLVCPYPGCFFFGDYVDIKEKSHPSAPKSRMNLSLDFQITSNQRNSNANMTLIDIIPDKSTATDDILVLTDDYNKEYKVMMEVIDGQIKATEKSSYRITKTQRLLMYQAFKNMIEKYPTEMVSYLVHLKQQTDMPLHSKIFQEYVSLVENHMPFSIFRKDEEIFICSLTDKNLGLFEGISKFTAKVKSDKTIPNLTEEKYIGGRSFKEYGRCFIGKIIDLTDKSTGKSVRSSINSYSFSKITTNLEPGTEVEVTHFRILPHYEIGSLVFLQKVRSNIIDKVYFRLHGKKREKRKVNKKKEN